MQEKLTWLYYQILHHNPTLEELDKAWSKDSLNNNTMTGLSRQTFNNWKNKLEVTYGIEIKYRIKNGEYRYYINASPGDDKVQDWMIRTTAVRNMLVENISIRDRIILEDIPSVSGSLEEITRAVRENLVIAFTYRDYWEDEVQVVMKPYFMKLFRQRWHVVGPLLGKEDEPIESFDIGSDRMSNLKVLSAHFKYPKDFSPQEFYRDNFSTLKDPNVKVERVVILAWEKQNFYIDSVPLHHSQRLVRQCDKDGYSIFEYWIEPTYDFVRELMSHGSYIEVLEPAWLRKEMINEARAVIGEYHGKSRKSCKEPIPESSSLKDGGTR